jgi:hypothetical protein
MLPVHAFQGFVGGQNKHETLIIVSFLGSCSSHYIAEILLTFCVKHHAIDQSFFSWKTKKNILATSQLTMSIH